MTDTRRGPAPLNLTRDEWDMLRACVEMMEDNISVDCEGEESVETFNSLQQKVYNCRTTQAK